VAVEEGAYSTAKQLLVAVTSELTGKHAGLVSKGKKCGLNVVVLEGFKAKRPVVAGGAVDKDESELVPTDGDAVSKSSVDMDDVEIFSRELSIALPRGAFKIVAYVPRERGNSPVLCRTPSFVLEIIVA